jgi:hypothetical protein
MTKKFIITAIAGNGDTNRSIEAGQRIYAAQFHWMPVIGASIWYDNRQEAVEIIADQYNKNADFLRSGSIMADNWEILELTYETKINAVSEQERDAVIRESALRRLTNDERRVLGL